MNQDSFDMYPSGGNSINIRGNTIYLQECAWPRHANTK